MDAPSIGIHSGIPFNDYLLWPGMNGSTLCSGMVSMRHLDAAINGLLDKKTKATTLGRAVHCRLLEPHVFHETYLIATNCTAKTKTGKNAGQECGNAAYLYDGDGRWRCGTHAKAGVDDFYEPPAFITPENSIALERIYQAVCNEHPAAKLLHLQGGYEVSISWECEGVLMKSRVDKDIANPKKIPPTIVDLKKVNRGGHTREAFRRAIENYHYDVKAAIYVDALKSIDSIAREFVWVVVEESEPHDVAVYQCDKATLAIGRYKYRKLLDDYKKCVETNVWPGYEKEVTQLGLSDWHKQKFVGLLT